MKLVKRIEIVIESAELSGITRAAAGLGIKGYTVMRHAEGHGERGARRSEPIAEEFENLYLLIACDEGQAVALVEAIRPILRRAGGMCLVSDAQWVLHE